MRIIMQVALITGALLLPCKQSARGQSGHALNGPSLGLMLDSSAATLRPILGIPGAATLGSPLTPGFDMARAVVAPGGDFALAVEKHGLRVSIVRSTGVVLRNVTPVLGAAPDLIAFSPNGGSAAVYYRIPGRLLVLTELRSQTPRVVIVDTSSAPAAPSHLAVSEDAAFLILAVPEGDTDAVYLLPSVPANVRAADPKGRSETDSLTALTSGSEAARRIGSFSSISALRFAGNSYDALIAEGAANAVQLVQDASGTAQISTLGSAQDGLAEPVAVESVDSRRVLVANAGTGKLTMLYRDGTPAWSIGCDCVPTTLQAMAGTSIYRLTESSKGPTWLIDAGHNEARILAIPPAGSQDASVAAVEGVQR